MVGYDRILLFAKLNEIGGVKINALKIDEQLFLDFDLGLTVEPLIRNGFGKLKFNRMIKILGTWHHIVDLVN